MFDHDEAFDFPLQESAQKHRIVAEGHTALRLTVRAMHVRMCKHAIAAKHLVFVDRNEPDGANPVERLLPQDEIIDIRRRGPSILHADIARIIQAAAETGVRFQRVTVGSGRQGLLGSRPRLAREWNDG